MVCCFQDGDSVLAQAPLEEHPPSENWTLGEELQPFPADTAVLEANGHEKEKDMLNKIGSD